MFKGKHCTRWGTPFSTFRLNLAQISCSVAAICPLNWFRRRNSTSGSNFDTCLPIWIFLCVINWIELIMRNFSQITQTGDDGQFPTDKAYFSMSVTMGEMPTRKHVPKMAEPYFRSRIWQQILNREARIPIPVSSSHMSISLSFGDIFVWQGYNQTNRQTTWTMSWPHIVAGQLINDFRLQFYRFFTYLFFFIIFWHFDFDWTSITSFVSTLQRRMNI